MRILLCLSAAIALAAEPVALTPGGGSKFAFEVAKTGLLNGKKHDFRFTRYSGKLDLDEKTPANSKVSFTIDPKSLQSLDEWSPAKGSVDKILKEAWGPALQVDKYPEIKFQSTSITAQGPETFVVKGDLTVRGQPKPVTVNVTRKQTGKMYTYEGTSTFLMTDYGIKPPTAMLGSIGTKPEIVVAFTITADK